MDVLVGGGACVWAPAAPGGRGGRMRVGVEGVGLKASGMANKNGKDGPVEREVWRKRLDDQGEPCI